MTLLERLDRLPPFLCYYAAHYGWGKRPTVDELVAASGLPLRTFTRNAWKTSWARVRVEVMEAIAKACRVDLLNPESVIQRFSEEMKKEKPFAEFSDGRNRRARMLKSLNRYAARAVVSKG